MQGNEIFGPFFGMMVLTLVVWLVLYYRRITFLTENRVHAQKVATPRQVDELIPDDVQHPANNFKNLGELPVLFYALCLYLFVSGNVDAMYVYAGWIYVGVRAIHSGIQCTTNNVMHRFVAYMISSMVLWAMVLRAAAQSL